MVKKNFKCVICAKIGQVYSCSHCLHNFCRECLESYNPTWLLVDSLTTAESTEISDSEDEDEDENENENENENNTNIGVTDDYHYENDTNMGHSEEGNILIPSFREDIITENDLEIEEQLPKSNRIVVDYCAFNCLKSMGENYCYDCGGIYMRTRQCISCHYNFCTLCQKNNLFETKNILPEHKTQASLFCSKTCYEIYTEQPNNEWCICENCGTEYFDIAYSKCCELCLEKYNFHSHKSYNKKRKEIIDNLKGFIDDKHISLSQVSAKVKCDVDVKLQEYKSIKELKVDIITWFTSSHVGNNLSYNIWDKVISDFLVKN